MNKNPKLKNLNSKKTQTPKFKFFDFLFGIFFGFCFLSFEFKKN